MSSDSEILEAELRELRAASLDEALLSRLDAVADGTWTTLDSDEIRLEKSLRAILPSKLSQQLLADCEVMMAGIPFAVDEKIVMFPKRGAPAARNRRPMWAAAAAVALVGAASALLMPSPATKHVIANRTQPDASPAGRVVSTNLVPASFNRGVSEVHDEGVVWKSGNRPHSVARVVYKDRITLKDENGRIIEVEQPRVEYMMVPAKTD